MTKKLTRGAVNKTTKLSVFDRIIREIDSKEIPLRYIDYVLIQYYNGSVVEIKGNDLTGNVPAVNEDCTGDLLNKMRDVKIFVNTDKLEREIDIKVEEYLGKYC